ncbi:c-type cytochrome [Candidatus Palauibacter sp.]|uniref:c-type cytochrome n=1 Tax=Candidatus Palauibacter sp. TaxID=3101350 RepID=UPI003B526C14
MSGAKVVSRLLTLAALMPGLAACGADEGGQTTESADSSMTVTIASGDDQQVTGRAGAAEPVYGFGTPATESQIAAWDIDIGPDGAGLPPGQGTVAEGLEVWERHRCILCHGPTGREGPNDIIAGRIPGDEFPFANDRSLRSTVGNYWPYATTLFDYTRRAMPFDLPGTMTDEEVYAVVGAMLYFNDLLPADAVVDAATVVDTHMPARNRFVPDNRTGGPIIR